MWDSKVSGCCILSKQCIIVSTLVVIDMKFIKRAFGEFHKFHMKRFRLSFDPLKWDFIAFKMNNVSKRKRIVDMDVADDVMCSCQCVITRVVIRFL